MALETVQDYSIKQVPHLHILVAENEKPVHLFLKITLEREGHHVTMVEKGEDVFHALESKKVDILILDKGLLDISGIDICHHLHKDPLWQLLPIIMLTEYQFIKDKVEELPEGVSDYLVKPFTADDLFTHLHNVYEHCRKNIEVSPLTRLPGSIAIEREISRRMIQQHKFSVLYYDINHFKSYNDTYGFVRGDAIIRATARILLSCTEHRKDFVGHGGGDNFIIVTSPNRAPIICESTIEKFDALIPEFYNEHHRAAGFVITRDRKGISHKFPLISLAIGGVSNEWKELTSPGEISAIGIEMKRFAKQQGKGKSAYAFDRRRNSTRDDIASYLNRTAFEDPKGTIYILNKNHQRRIAKVLQIIKKELSAPQNKENRELLSIGCGSGIVEKQIMDLGIKVCGIDSSCKAIVETQRKGIEALVADITHGLPFDNNRFDMVFAGEIIEHIIDTQKFLLEVKRVLKPGGTFILTTPNMARLIDRIRFLFGKAPKHASPLNILHIRPFTFDSLKVVLKDAGFTINQVASNVVAYDFTLLFNFKSAWLADLFPTLGKNLIVKAFSSHDPSLKSHEMKPQISETEVRGTMEKFSRQ
jgi:DNA-binding response OmpR family regulator/2-polyprenyl-3-methyl-5-hydroxy-6-metoxy-1,4-benzoquinol methylase